MIALWSVKGGSGTSVFAAQLAVALSRWQPTTLVDLGGDQPAILGVDDAELGVRQWLRSDPSVSPDALDRLSVSLSDSFNLFPSGPPTSEPVDATLASKRLEAALPAHAVVDVGIVRSLDELSAQIVMAASTSLMVLRPCFLSVRRASLLALDPDGLVVVDEPGRSLDANDLAEVIGVPTVAVSPIDSSVARAVDAGRLLGKRAPRARAIDDLARTLLDGAGA